QPIAGAGKEKVYVPGVYSERYRKSICRGDSERKGDGQDVYRRSIGKECQWSYRDGENLRKYLGLGEVLVNDWVDLYDPGFYEPASYTCVGWRTRGLLAV